jgi:hypothetical protein
MGQQDGSWCGFRACHPLPKCLATFNAESLTPFQWVMMPREPEDQDEKKLIFFSLFQLQG